MTTPEEYATDTPLAIERLREGLAQWGCEG